MDFSSFFTNPFSLIGDIGGGINSGINSLLGDLWQNPSNSAMPYLQQAENQLPGYFQPYMQAGQNAINPLQQQYGALMSNPGGMLNAMGANYQQSPGYQFQLQQDLNAAKNSAGAGGMLGGSQAQQNAASVATGLANQDYYNYLNKVQGLYGAGLQGAQGMMNQGGLASMGLGEDLSSLFGSQGQLAYLGQQGQNQAKQNLMGSLFGGAMGLLPFLGGL